MTNQTPSYNEPTIADIATQLQDFTQQFQEFKRTTSQEFGQLHAEISAVKTDLSGLKEDIKGWQGWLRLTSGTIAFTIAVSFLGILLGVLIPIGIALWRQSLI